jgi:hypothetical protein
MTTEIDILSQPSALTLLPPAQHPAQAAIDMLRGHAEMMGMAYDLATKMCRTQLVPTRFRGKPEDAAAAILYGAELGLNPIQSLQRVVPIHGMPTLEARTMVALLKSAATRSKPSNNPMRKSPSKDTTSTANATCRSGRSNVPTKPSTCPRSTRKQANTGSTPTGI